MSKTMKPLLLGSSVVLAAGMGMEASAQGVDLGDFDFYAGASIGESMVETDVGGPGGLELGFDENDTAWKAYVGGNFGLLGVEGGYVNFGEPSGGGVDVEVDGWDLFGVLNLPIGPVDAFAKAGYIWWDADIDVDGFRGGDDGEDPVYGLGASFEVANNFNIRGEYEWFDVDEFDTLDMWSVGAEYRF